MGRILSPQHQALWWHSPTQWKQDTLTPVKPFTAYNPFDWYFTEGQGGRGKRSLPYLFLDVDAKDLEAVGTFCGKFGVLGSSSREVWKQLESQKVDDLWEGLVSTGALKHPEETSTATTWKALLKKGVGGVGPTSTLCVPMTVQEFEGRQATLRHAITVIQQIEEGATSQEAKRNRELLSRLFALKLEAARPNLYWDDLSGQWGTNWQLGTLEAALYLMILFDLQGNGKILTCPLCQTIFLGDHPKARFCSGKCQNLFNVRKVREKGRQVDRKKK